jgi:ABC-type Na+ transport system ATPase subunit NatA
VVRANLARAENWITRAATIPRFDHLTQILDLEEMRSLRKGIQAIRKRQQFPFFAANFCSNFSSGASVVALLSQGSAVFA